MKLGLGTVQFGLAYGISNQDGKTPKAEVVKIIEAAAKSGVSVLDTACLYGTSEEILGQCLPQNHDFRIVTKTPKFAKQRITPQDVEHLEASLHQSLAKLGQANIYGLLIHHVDDLFAENGPMLFESMLKLKQMGLVQKIGASIYTGQQIEQLMAGYSVDLIQIPINILDQRLLQGQYLFRLKAAGIEIHARSVFLQGLLLMDPASLPDYFAAIKDHLADYHRVLGEQGLSAVEAALGYVLGLKEVDVVLCGVTNLQELEELCQKARPLPTEKFTRYAIKDESILNPAIWRI